MNFLSLFLSKFFEFWHKTVSLVLPGACRFEPSCSLYAAEAFKVHGFWVGTWLTARRLGRCHPWGGHGYDPCPQILKSVWTEEGHS